MRYRSPEDQRTVFLAYDEKVVDSGRAVLFRILNKRLWIPKSQIVEEGGDENGGMLVVTEWIALQKGLI